MTMNMGNAMKMGDNMTIPSGITGQALNLASKHVIESVQF